MQNCTPNQDLVGQLRRFHIVLTTSKTRKEKTPHKTQNKQNQIMMTTMVNETTSFPPPPPTECSSQSLFSAAAQGNMVALYKLVIIDHVDVNSECYQGRTALCHAAEHNQAQVVRFLLHHGARVVHISHDCGWTPMHWAAWNGNGKICKLLLEGSCKRDIMSIPNDCGETPMELVRDTVLYEKLAWRLQLEEELERYGYL